MDQRKDTYQGSLCCRDSIQMRRTRQHLASSKRELQRAIAEFPLRIASCAMELKRMIDLVDHGMPKDEKVEEAMQFVEDQIRNCFRDTFGRELPS